MSDEIKDPGAQTVQALYDLLFPQDCSVFCRFTWDVRDLSIEELQRQHEHVKESIREADERKGSTDWKSDKGISMAHRREFSMAYLTWSEKEIAYRQAAAGIKKA